MLQVENRFDVGDQCSIELQLLEFGSLPEGLDIGDLSVLGV